MASEKSTSSARGWTVTAPVTKAKSTSCGVTSLADAIAAEFDEIGGREASGQGSPTGTASDDQDERWRAVRRDAHDMEVGHTALCFSGGGIRSASFNLGVLQGLARVGLLERFDYLSSVSGGGYIASWFEAWIRRHREKDEGQRADDPIKALAGHGSAEREPKPIAHLRRFSNYLTPRLGAFSADTWTVGAIVVRNALLNQLVLLPFLAAVVAVPQLANHLGSDGTRFPPMALYWFGVLALLVAHAVAYAIADGDRKPQEPAAQGNGAATESRGHSGWWVVLSVGMLALGAQSLSASAAFSSAPVEFWDIGPVVLCTVAGFLVPVVAYAVTYPWRMSRGEARRGDFIAVAVGGVVTALAYRGLWWATAESLGVGIESAGATGGRVIVFGLPLVVVAVFAGQSLFVAFESVTERSGRRASELGDSAREWWARWAGWMLAVAIGWLVLAALSLGGPWAFGQLAGQDITGQVVTWLSGGGLGVLVGLLGKWSASGGGTEDDAASSKWASWLLALAAPLFCLVIGILVAQADNWIATQLNDTWLAARLSAKWGGSLLVVLGGIAIGLAAGLLVNVNRFSLQALYRNRLVRAYLGASNQHRRANWFTGFDHHDNLRLHDLKGNRPLPVINIALNVVGGKELAWQERKAMSFTATPLHCGSGGIGKHGSYRDTSLYGGPDGISLGTAFATSGAAANPSMGHHSSPPVALIMTLFNARLGAWLGNPGPAGDGTYRKSGPTFAARPIMAEAFGLTDEQNRYVSLSDGGHFENLALYEMVRRRCRWIVVCDAGCDPKGEYADLGNAVRKIRVDLRIPIEFEGKFRIPSSGVVAGDDATYAALARIRYEEADRDVYEKSAADAKRVPDGWLIYLKPALLGHEPSDVLAYAKTAPTFPHETTADQWFSESQFEAYRALGEHVIMTLAKENPDTSFGDLESFKDCVAKIVEPKHADVAKGAAASGS